MRLCYNNATYCLEMLKSNKDNFSDNRFSEIQETIKNIIKQDGNEYCTMESIYNRYLDFEEESEYNGQKKIDIKKVNSVIGYFASYVNPLYKVKLMKLLWYADSLYYKYFNKSITGLVYQHLPLGAVPIACNEILNLPSIRVEEEYSNEYVMYRIYPNMQINISDFTLDELEVLQRVASYFKDYKTKDIVEYMHNEKAYKKTKFRDVISFEYAGDLQI